MRARERGWPPKARYLFKLFMALRLASKNDKWRFITACKASKTCFQKLAEMLEAHDITDEVGFMISQCCYWDITKIYPAHLISPYAVLIYRRWREEQAPIAKEEPNQEGRMLEALCRARREPKQQVLRLLCNSGLFSQEFLSQHSF